MKKIILLFIYLVVTISCSTIELERSRSNKVRLGMTKQQVLDIMGQPTRWRQFPNNEEQNAWQEFIVVFQNEVVVNTASRNIGVFSIQLESYYSISPEKKIVSIMPSNQNMSIDDLEFQSVKRIISDMLKSKGYTVSDDSKKIDVVVFINFGVSGPKTETKYWNEPVYDYVMPQTQQDSNTTHNVYNQYGQNLGQIKSQTTYGNPYDIAIPQQVYKGSIQRSRTKTSFVRHLILEAVDYKSFLKNKKIKQFWKTVAISEGSSDDIRKVLPFLAYVAKQYVEKDSGSKQTSLIFENDPRVLESDFKN